MARVTIEDCVKRIPNRFLLVQAGIKRTRQIMEGAKPLTSRKNREVVLALREIADGKVKPILDPNATLHLEPRGLQREVGASRGSILDEVAMEQMGIREVGSSAVDLEELGHGFHEVEAEQEDEE